MATLMELKMVFITIAIYVIFLITIIAYCSASMTHSAHLSHAKLSSIMAKSMKKDIKKKRESIPLHEVFNVINLFERLAGPSIAVYCLDMFPLNYYEFYLFVASVSCNFFLAVQILEPY
jgi:hypothetical protein